MKLHISKSLRKLLIVPPIAVGIVVVAFLIRNKQEAERSSPSEAVRVLRVVVVPEVDVVPRVLGYGTAEPGEVWRAVAEVKGRVVAVHSELKSGSLVNKHEELIRIDGTEYELSVARLNSEIEQVSAEISEVQAREANDRASLIIEEKSLVLVEGDLNRIQQLAKKNAATQADVDQKQREVLTQRQNVQSLKNSLNIVPAEKRSLQATLAVKKASLAQAELDQKKTVITAPFNCRLGDVKIEKGQFLSAGEALFEAHSTAVTEIEAQVPLDHARNLIRPGQKLPLTIDMEAVRKMLDVKATVRLRSGDFAAEWEGRLARVREQVDPETRAVSFVVAVDKPYEKVIPGERPPLVKGTFCEVELRGKVQPAQIVIPRSALHDEFVYVVNSDNRLEKRKVEIAFAQSNFYCLESGLRSGETLIVSDPTPAIEGMLIEPVADDELLQSLVAEATGEGGLR